MEKDLKSKNFIKGMKTRREVLGNEHVERAVKNTNKIVRMEFLRTLSAFI